MFQRLIEEKSITKLKIRGSPDDYYTSKGGAQTVKNSLGEKYWYNGNTRVFDMPILQWNTTEMGRYMKYVFIESDGGSNANIETSITSSLGTSMKVTIPARSKDKTICEAVVSYDDPALGDGTKYGNPLFEFWVNIHP